MTNPSDYDENLSNRAIKLFVAASSMAALNNILYLLSDRTDFEIVETALDGESCLQGLANVKVDIVIVELALPKISGVKVAEYLSLERPEIATVILADQSNLGFYRSAMLAGAREFLITPIPGEEFAFSLRRVYEMEAERRQKRKMSGWTKKQTLTGQVRNKNGKVITIMSGKGGTGRSFISANLAHIFSQALSGTDIAVADFDLQFGDIGAIFNVPAKKSLVDLVPVIDELNLMTLKSVAVKVSGNLDLYSNPPQLERSELITSYHTVRLIDAFRQNYDLTLINTGSLMTEIHIDLMEKSDYVLLVANPEVLSVKACAQIKTLYDKMGFNKNAVGCVVNKHNNTNMLNAKRIAETLQVAAIASVPFLPDEVAALLNEGKLVSDIGSASLKASFTELAKKLADQVGMVAPVTS